jgi:hypothetical protein
LEFLPQGNSSESFVPGFRYSFTKQAAVPKQGLHFAYAHHQKLLAGNAQADAIWMFPKMVIPQNHWFQIETLKRGIRNHPKLDRFSIEPYQNGRILDDFGYHYSRKPSYQ